jgi:2-haloacid dehalogenase
MARENVSGTVKVLVFDSYGTLFDMRGVTAACERFFPGQGADLGRLWRARQLEYTWLLSLMGRYVDFWQVTERALGFACRALRLPLADSARKGLMESHLRLEAFPDVKGALDALSGYRLAILSNGASWMLGEVVAHNGLERYFARLVSADEAGSFKPDPRVYNLAPSRLSVDPAEMLYVCGNSWDLCGALSAGLRGCWLSRGEDPWEELGFRPEATAGGLAELPELLGRRKGEADGHHAA